MLEDAKVYNRVQDVNSQNYSDIFKKFDKTELWEVSRLNWEKIVCFDGVEKLMQEISKRYDFVTSTGKTAIVIPPSGFFTAEDIIDMNYFLFNNLSKNTSGFFDYLDYYSKIAEFYQQRKKVSREAANLFSDYVKGNIADTGEKWDDRELYRMYAIIEFVSQDKYKTLGEFVEANDKHLQEKTLYADFSEFTEHHYFISRMIEKGTVLAWRKRSLKKAEELIYSLNKEEIQILMERNREYISPAKYMTHLKNLVEMVKVKNTMSKDEISKTLSEISLNIAQREEYWNNGLFRKANKLGQGTVFYVDDFTEKDVSPDFVKIVKTVEDNYQRMTMMDFIVLLKIFPRSNYIVRSSDFDKYLKIVNLAIEKMNDPVPFFKFSTRLFLEHEGIVPSYTEWMKYLRTIEPDEDFSLPLSLTLPMIVERNQPTETMLNNMEIIKSVRNSFERIVLPEDKES